ncbi:MAG TPA: helix-turn-helix domain-containing protein [Caulobacteraceae bacterium]|jgi:y4mF family transcriptional regulator
MSFKIDPKKTPRAARLLEAVRAQATAQPVTMTTALPTRGAQPLTAKKLDRTIRFPKPENALRQHAAEGKASAASTPDMRVRLKPQPALPKAQASPQARARPSERQTSPSLRPAHTMALGRGALGAAAQPGALVAIPTAAQLGRLVRLRRADLGLSQAELAGSANVGRRFVAELETGKPSLELGRALSVCAVLGIQIFAAVDDYDG